MHGATHRREPVDATVAAPALVSHPELAATLRRAEEEWAAASDWRVLSADYLKYSRNGTFL